MTKIYEQCSIQACGGSSTGDISVHFHEPETLPSHLCPCARSSQWCTSRNSTPNAISQYTFAISLKLLLSSSATMLHLQCNARKFFLHLIILDFPSFALLAIIINSLTQAFCSRNSHSNWDPQPLLFTLAGRSRFRKTALLQRSLDDLHSSQSPVPSFQSLFRTPDSLLVTFIINGSFPFFR